MGNNLTSPNSITKPVNLTDLWGWLIGELGTIESEAIRSVTEAVARHAAEFIRWPARAVLLWHGCDRVVPKGQPTVYHKYPAELKQLAKQASLQLDSRANGPAVAAFLYAGGKRPVRFGSSNAWSVHHIYSGKFPYPERLSTMHAAKKGEHFSQSAGLVAVHPIADAVCDESPALSWWLRAEAFRRFGYDPDGVFSQDRDDLGFSPANLCEVLYRVKNTGEFDNVSN